MFWRGKQEKKNGCDVTGRNHLHAQIPTNEPGRLSSYGINCLVILALCYCFSFVFIGVFSYFTVTFKYPTELLLALGKIERKSVELKSHFIY